MSLTSSYLGFPLKNPMIASASPLNANLPNLLRLEDAGAAAVVLPSLFEEQIEAEERALDDMVISRNDSNPEALTYMPAATSGPYGLSPERYVDLVRRARDRLAIPVIASLNGCGDAGWVEYAALMEQAGASAIELNVQLIPTDLELSAVDVESRHLRVLRAVRAVVRIPVAVKLAPSFSALGHFARQLVADGANGLVLFNRFFPLDIDLISMRLSEDLRLSDAREMHWPLLWITLLSGRTGACVGASTGVETANDAMKYILAGADAVMVTSSLLRHGIDHMADLVDGLGRWLDARHMTSLDEVRGLMSWQKARDKNAYERKLHMRGLADHQLLHIGA